MSGWGGRQGGNQWAEVTWRHFPSGKWDHSLGPGLWEDLEEPPNTKKRCPFHHRGLEGKSRKSGDTWSNRRVWPWRTEWSRAEADRVLGRERTGHSKDPPPTTQEETLHITSKMASLTHRLFRVYCLISKQFVFYYLSFGLLFLL